MRARPFGTPTEQALARLGRLSSNSGRARIKMKREFLIKPAHNEIMKDAGQASVYVVQTAEVDHDSPHLALEEEGEDEDKDKDEEEEEEEDEDEEARLWDLRASIRCMGWGLTQARHSMLVALAQKCRISLTPPSQPLLSRN